MCLLIVVSQDFDDGDMDADDRRFCSHFCRTGRLDFDSGDAKSSRSHWPHYDSAGFYSTGYGLFPAASGRTQTIHFQLGTLDGRQICSYPWQ